jgi:predicted DNA-binding transcriptional regulator YafY
MNRTDRLLAIVLELQGKGKQRAEDLAAVFETSKRTIYRDMQALGEAGVPLISTPGHGYALMEGYFLPPLSFSADEATLLVLGCEVVGAHFDDRYRSAAESAGRKVAAVLPDRQRAEVQRLKGGFRFVAGTRDRTAEAEKLAQLRSALAECRTVRFRYVRRHGDEGDGRETVREADPYRLVSVRGAWYLSAYCHLRRDVRNFRLERMDAIETLDQSFAPPADLLPRAQCTDQPAELLVRARFDAETARWVRESLPFQTVSVEEEAGGLLLVLRVRREQEMLQWLLGWGSHVRVLEPASLRRLIAEEAEALLRAHGARPVSSH